jgi:hypothetical protein
VRDDRGGYLIVVAILTVIVLLAMRETKDTSLENPFGDHVGDAALPS